jgi:hypothetical protein
MYFHKTVAYALNALNYRGRMPLQQVELIIARFQTRE